MPTPNHVPGSNGPLWRFQKLTRAVLSLAKNHRVSQVATEVLTQAPSNARVSQVAIEVLKRSPKAIPVTLAGTSALSATATEYLMVGATKWVGTSVSTSSTISLPAGVQDGDLLVLGAGDTGNANPVLSVSGGGWAVQIAGFHSDGLGGVELEVFSKIASGEPASYTISGGTIRQAFLTVYRGVTSVTADATARTTSGTPSQTAPSVTPTQPNDLEIVVVVCKGGTTFTVPDSTWIKRAGFGNATSSLAVFDRILYGPTTPTGGITPGGGNTNPLAVHLLFKTGMPRFDGSSSLSSAVRGYKLVTLSLAGQGHLTATVFRHWGLRLAGVGHLTSSVTQTDYISPTFAGRSSLSATLLRSISPTFAGTSSLSTTVFRHWGLRLAGTSSLTVTVTATGATTDPVVVTLAGTSSLSARFSHRQFACTLAGFGHLRIFSVFDPNAVGVGPGNGGEVFGLRLAPNGVTETALLDGAISTTDSTLSLTGDSAFPDTDPFVVTIDSEVLYLIPRGGGTYSVRGRALSNTVSASHSDGASVAWSDTYDMAILSGNDVAHEFTADIASSGSFTYPGWLICFDSSQAYLDTDRYPFHVTSVLGVFDAGAGQGGTNRCDAAQPNAVCTPVGVSDDCPAALSNPSRISSDILIGDVALVQYTNPEAVVLDLGPRSAALQSWFGLMRVDATDTDVTFTDPTGYVVDTIPPSPFTGSVNDVWGNPIPLLTGIDPIASDEDPAHAPIYTSSPVPWTTVTLPGTERYFTYGPPYYSRAGWPMCCVSVRQNNRRIPYWASWDWRDYNFVYTGFGPDYTYAQLMINRNGILFDLAEVTLPGPQDIDGPDAEWDDPTYFVAASWYVVLYNGPYIVFGPGIGGGFTPGSGSAGGGGFVPGVTFPGGPGGPPVITVPPIEGGSGGGISPPVGSGLRARIRYSVSGTP